MTGASYLCPNALPSAYINFPNERDAEGNPLHTHPPETEDEVILTPKRLRFQRFSWWRETLYWLVVLGTAGFALLVFRWCPSWEAYLRYAEVSPTDLYASTVLIVSQDGVPTICPILARYQIDANKHAWRFGGAKGDVDRERMFVWRKERFWFRDRRWFRRSFNTRQPYQDLHRIAGERISEAGKAAERARDVRLATYGENVTAIEVPPFWLMVVLEAIKPFFVFQVFSLIIWFMQQYVVYCGCILAMTCLSILANAFGEWQNLQALSALARSEGTVHIAHVSEKGEMEYHEASTAELMPGDLIVVTPDTIVPCDLLLVTGTAIMGEAMLTGESAPVLKASIPWEDREGIFKHDSDACKKYILFSGTKVLQTRALPYPSPSASGSCLWDRLDGGKPQKPMALGMVLRTGFSTARGQLIRAIMFPPPPKFDFEAQGYRFIWLLVGALVAGGIAQIVIYAQQGVDATTTVLDLLNLVTIAIPPALPLALTIGLQVSFNRLRKKGIFCSHTRSVAASGRVNCLCFDKTGTLTEDGLTLTGVQVASGGQLGGSITNPTSLYHSHASKVWEGVSSLGLMMSFVLAACHGIALLDEVDRPVRTRKKSLVIPRGPSFRRPSLEDAEVGATNEREEGKPTFIGDSLEVEVFQRSGWQYLSRYEGVDSTAGITLSEQPGPEAYTPDTIWAHPSLPKSGVDTVLFPPDSDSECTDAVAIAILRRLDFDADLRRMGVVIQLLPLSQHGRTGATLLVVKGAPEVMPSICLPASMPSNFNTELRALTLQGLRVLGCGVKEVSPSSINLPRSELESGLSFVGLMKMENRLKKETVGYLRQYQDCRLRLCMITGDNPMTAGAVAKMSGAFLDPAASRILVLDAEGPVNGYDLVLTDMVDPSYRLNLLGFLTGHAGFDRLAVLVPPYFCEGVKEVLPTTSTATSEAVDLVVTGRAFEALLKAHRTSSEDYPEVTSKKQGQRVKWTALELVIARCNVFARMSPQDKQDLVRQLQDLDLVVCMTGDGANDSGALKAGDIGISIAAKEHVAVDSSGSTTVSAEEAAVLAAPSIAAPFSTGIHHIGAVNTILTEGRCALMTSVTTFKYMFVYGIIQFTGVLILYYLLLELADTQYLYADMGTVLGFVTVIPLTAPRRQLQRGRPEPDLVSWTVLRSAVGQALIVVSFQILQQVMLFHQGWYTKSVMVKDGDFTNIPATVEASSKFIFSNYQYIFCITAYAQTYGLFRQPVYKHPVIVLYYCYQLSMLFTINFSPSAAIRHAFQMTELPRDYRVYLCLLGLLNAAVLLGYERWLVPRKSLDEDPVPEDRASSPAKVMGAADPVGDVRKAEAAGCCHGMDGQLTLLPKLRAGAPLYHQANEAWAAAAGQKGGKQV